MLAKRLQQWLVCVGIASALAVNAQERYEVLRVGGLTYSNVLVVNKMPADLYITHAQGLSNIKVVDLDPALADELGYDQNGGAPRRTFTMPTMAKLPVKVSAAEVEQMQARLNQDLSDQIATVPKGVLLGTIAGVLVLYLFFCVCCKLICDKAGAPSKLLVWLPGLQMFPLFRAAKMSPWLVFGYLVPHILAGVFVAVAGREPDPANPRTLAMLVAVGGSFLVPFILHIVWCVKIARARDKSGFVAFALWFPPTSAMTFLYLAFSEGPEPLPEAPLPRPNYVTFS